MVRLLSQIREMGSPKEQELWAILPSALWDVDFSAALTWIESRQCPDARSFKLLLRSDSQALNECLRRLRVRDVSAGAIKLVGAIDREDCIERSASFLTEESKADFVRILMAAFRRKATVQLETAIVTKAGEPLDVEVQWCFTPGGDGRLTRAIVSVVDISEERKLHQRLMLAERMSTIGTLTASVTHEIKNPLTFVWNHLQALQRPEHKMPRETRQLVREAFEGADRIRAVTREITELSHEPDDTVELVSLEEALDSAIRLAGPEVKHRATVVRDYAVEPLQIEASKARVGQVFVNLIVNAAQAIPSGDRKRNQITVKTRRSEDGQISVEIQDTGPGIPPHLLRRIFDPFVTTKPSGRGTGLGLSICQSIVHSMDGTIDLQSQPGQGTIARVVFPRSARARKITTMRPQPVSAIHAATKQRLRMLVVDDEPVIARLIKKVFAKHDVTCAHDGREAISLMSANDYDVVLCDLIMPEMTGMDVYRAALQRPTPVHERIVFMTGGAFTARARDFLHRIPNLRVEKPFELSQLERMVYEAARLGTKTPSPDSEAPARRKFG